MQSLSSDWYYQTTTQMNWSYAVYYAIGSMWLRECIKTLELIWIWNRRHYIYSISLVWWRTLIIFATNYKLSMMTSSNENIFRVTGPLCGEFTGPGDFPTQRPVTRIFDVSLICVWINGWINNREAGDLRRYRAHSDVIVMWFNDDIEPQF